MKNASLVRRVVTWLLVVVALSVIGYRFALPFTPPWIDVVFIVLSVIILVVIWAARRKKPNDEEGQQ